MLSRSPLLVTERKRAEFNNKDAGQDLGRLLRKKSGEASTVSARPELDRIYATAALAAVIKYLEVSTGVELVKMAYLLKNVVLCYVYLVLI